MNVKQVGTALAVAAGLCTSAASVAQSTFPNQPLRIVVGYAAGGTTDILARALGEQLGKELKQPVIIENKAGAAGNLAASYVQQASPDGYTLFMATVSSHGINPAVYKKSLGYDPVGGFTPVSMIASIPLVLVTTPNLPAKSVDELVALAKSKPGELNYSSSGNGSPVHLAAAMFAQEAKVNLQHVPYRGGALANTSVMSGETQLSFATLPAALPQVKADKLRALAVTTKTRSSELPDVPALSEIAMFKDYDINTWNGLMAPAGTPPDRVKILNEAIARALQAPTLQQRFKGEGATAGASSPEELGKFVNAELVRWADVVQAVDIRIE